MNNLVAARRDDCGCLGTSAGTGMVTCFIKAGSETSGGRKEKQCLRSRKKQLWLMTFTPLR